MFGSEEDIVTSAVGNFLHFKLCGVRPGSTGTAVHVAVRPYPFVGNWKRIQKRHTRVFTRPLTVFEERERERETDRQTGRQTGRQTDRQTDRQTEREREFTIQH